MKILIVSNDFFRALGFERNVSDSTKYHRSLILMSVKAQTIIKIFKNVILMSLKILEILMVKVRITQNLFSSFVSQ